MATKTVIKKTKHYRILKDVDANTKCPPQAKVIIDTVKEAGEGTMSRADVIEKLKDGRLTTNQTPDRIFSFYRPRLIEMGVMAESVVETEETVEVPDPPAKAEPAAEGAEQPAQSKGKGKKGTKTVAAEEGEAAA